MSRANQVFVLLALAALTAVPVVTLHALLLHLHTVGLGNFGREMADPIFVLVLVLAASAALPAFGALTALRRCWVDAKRFRQISTAAPAQSLRGIRFRRLPGTDIALLTAGIRHPTIFVTDGAVSQLTEEMLFAALLHEQAHVDGRDTSWRPILAALESAFRGVAPVRNYVQGLVLGSEVSADAAAVNCGARRRALFEALVAGAQSTNVRLPNLTGGDLTARLTRLVEPETTMNQPRAGALLIATWALALPVGAHLLLALGFLCHTELLP